jgi:hypothetical protein
VQSTAPRGRSLSREAAAPLEKAREESLFGSKAVGLGQAVRDLRCLPGWLLDGSIAEAVAAGENGAIKEVTR